eukprot:TRINITY_DN101168_c0_g1_i1.p1 TRINITY_DN101168_c0_g1~~TRINITY_DN101168_c0_g1_i1.p1  ORF type:complete len:480 (-),score=78.05 TRINITY_DN101168_c0_g1_i1:99-1538(-)
MTAFPKGADLEHNDIAVATASIDGVPWFKSREHELGAGGREFAHHFYYYNAVSKDHTHYVENVEGEDLRYHFQVNASANTAKSYPLPVFCRRLTLNSWREMLMWALMDACGRVVALQANLQMAIMLIDNPLYENASLSLKGGFWGLYFLAVVLWTLGGLMMAHSYRQFTHPDLRVYEGLVLCGHALLLMLNVPNDIQYVLIHLLPQEKGGLLKYSGCIEGDRRWPVHTIQHRNRLDHDYTDLQGLSCQWPLFIFIDIGCTLLNLTISYEVGIFNYTAMGQMCSSFFYAFFKTYMAVNRKRQRWELLKIWVKTASDPLIPADRRQNAINKYLSEGGSRKLLIRALEEKGMELPNEPMGKFRSLRDRARNTAFGKQISDDGAILKTNSNKMPWSVYQPTTEQQASQAQAVAPGGNVVQTTTSYGADKPDKGKALLLPQKSTHGGASKGSASSVRSGRTNKDQAQAAAAPKKAPRKQKLASE